MKVKMITLFLVLTLSVSFSAVLANENSSGAENGINAYVGVGFRGVPLGSEAAGYLDGKIGIQLNEKWGIGLAGAALWYDEALDELVDDGTYHLSVAYAGVFIDRTFALTERLNFVVGITSGTGVAMYRYDNDYRKEKVWTEEIIDRTEFAMFEPAIEIQYQISDKLRVGINGKYLNTSPVQMIGTSEDLLREFSGGLTFQYNLCR